MTKLFLFLQGAWKRHSHMNWALVDQAMVSGVNLLTSILLARYLGLEEFGVFALVWMAVMFVTSIQEAIIINPMISIGPKQSPAEAPGYFTVILLQQIIFTIASFLLLLAGLYLYQSFYPSVDIVKLSIPLALASSAFQMQNYIRRYFYTNKLPRKAFANDIISYGGQMILIVWLGVSEIISTPNVLWAISATSFLAVAYGMRDIHSLKWEGATYCKEIIGAQWSFSKWLFASALMNWASGYLFIFVAAIYLGSAAAGIMRAAQTIMGVLHILFLGLENVIPVRSSNILTQRGTHAMNIYLLKITSFGAGITFLYSIIAASAPGYWLNLIFGAEYAQYGFVLQWYAAKYVITFFAIPIGAGLRAIEYTRPIFTAHLYGALFSITCSILMVQHFGLTGAVVGMFMVEAIKQVILFIAYERKFKELRV